jgi:hypothetical protein
MVNMIVLTDGRTGQILWKDQFPYAVLRPIRLVDNKYALPASVLTMPEHARWRDVLKRQGTVVDSEDLTFASVGPTNYRKDVNGHQMHLRINADAVDPASYGYPAPRLFDTPGAGVLRFECHHGNDIGSSDYRNNRRRVELSEEPEDSSYHDGEVLWDSWSTIITDQRAGLDQFSQSIIHQWHHASSAAFTSIYAPPPFAVVLNSGQLTINTRYGNAGTSIGTVHYTMTAPASWAVTHFVVQATLGAAGHLNVWINGEQVVNVDTPIGYYDESPPYLAYVQFGIYMDNTRTVDALYHINNEYGLTDLSSRVSNPLSFTIPVDEGIPAVAAFYPEDTLYPATNLYPS